LQLPDEVQSVSGLRLVAVENQGQHKCKKEDGINYVAQQGLLVPVNPMDGTVRREKVQLSRSGDNDQVIPVH